MAANTQPVFTNVPNVGVGLTSTTSNSALEGNALANATVLLTGGANGTRINEIDVTPVQTVLLGTVNIFLVDASNNFWLVDQVPIAAQTLTIGTPMTAWKKPYANLTVPSGWTLQVTQTCSGTQGLIACVAPGENF